MTSRSLRKSARRLLGLRTTQFGLAAGLVIAATVVLAQDSEQPAGAPKAGAPATEADYDVLRKLLGVQAPPSRQTAPAVEPEPEPEPQPEPEPVVSAPEPEPAKAAKPAARKPPPPRYRPKPRPAPRKAPALPEAARTPEPEPERTAELPAAAFISPDVPGPGTVVEKSNLDRWKDFISPSIEWVVRRGARLRVIENTPIEMEPARAEATQRYSPQARLSASKTSVVNYVAGIPFPFVQTDDPDAGIKMILNWDARIINDDFDIRNFVCQTGSFGSTTGLDIERDYLTGHFRRLYYIARLYHDPRPVMPNPEGIRYREMLHPVMEPFDLKGAGFTYNRYTDPRRQDDSWLYYPQTKRVRRLSTAQRSEGVFGQDIDLDSYGGYSGNPSWTEWRLLGTKTVIASMHGGMPTKWLPPPNDFLHDDVWEPRDVWVLEGRSRLAGYAFGSRVIYIDRESFLIPYTEIFDLQGRLWKGLVQNWMVGERTRPESKYTTDYKRLFLSGVALFDMQLDHATRCQLPGEAAMKNEDGWYMNVGDVEGTTETAFDVASFIGEGR